MDAVVNRVVERAMEEGHVGLVAEQPKLLFIDIETAPALSYVWSLFQKSPINHEMQVERTEMLGFCAKWLDSDEIISRDRRDEDMLETLWFLLDEAEFTVAHNGDRFDIKRINVEFLLNNFTPPSPYKQIDTLKMVKRSFGFDSNRLDYLARVLFGERKQKHDGFDTWVGCMKNDEHAWKVMMDYNAKDVVLLERIYLTVRAWDKSHPNVLTSFEQPPTVPACTVCGSTDVLSTNKIVSTNAGRYVGYECQDCGAQMREHKSVGTVPLRKAR